MSDGKEPVVWSHITDTLPEDHPLAHEAVYCNKCPPGKTMVHSDNECMQTWVEFNGEAWCGVCFGALLIKTDGILG